MNPDTEQGARVVSAAKLVLWYQSVNLDQDQRWLKENQDPHVQHYQT